MACEQDHPLIVDYLLLDLHLDPNTKNDRHQSPLSLTKSKEVMKLLIQHGADAEDVYTHHRKILGNVFSKDHLKSPVKMFVIGHSGEGKSTLIEAMEHEPPVWEPLVKPFIRPKEVDEVSQKTAGIVPRVFKSRFYGDVLFYDFAGQEAYYSSHAAVIKTSVYTCPPVFILVIGIHRDDTAITHSIFYWLGIITNQCDNMEGKAPLIVVGSHADLVKKSAEADRRKTISQAVKKYDSFKLIAVIPMDCRYYNSDAMKLLRHSIGTTCNSIRSKLSVSPNSLIYLIEKHSSELALTLEQVQTELETAIQQQSKKHKEVLPFIPTTIPRLVKICIQLSDKGHILFLLNETSLEKSFIIIDKTALLAEINGTMFAPQDFKQHCQLATSTGVVPRSKLAEQFPKFNSTMLIRFLSYLELAVPIEDQEVLHLINDHLGSLGTDYLFCPALIRLEVPPRMFTYQAKCLYHFAWILSTVQDDHFLDARFLHVLLLRLALSLGLAPIVDPKVPALQHQCSVWKTGVYWNTSEAAQVLVEVVDKKKVVVFIQSDVVSSELLKLRSSVLQKVREAASELCPSVVTEEILISPSDMNYPFSLASSTPLFSLKSIAQCIVQQQQFVVSVDSSRCLSLNEFEVYASLGERILHTIFSSPQDTTISDEFFSALCSSWSKSPQVVDIVCSVISREAVSTQNSKEGLLVALKTWRDGSESRRTYSSLRQILDPLSVFAGRNPLVWSSIVT